MRRNRIPKGLHQRVAVRLFEKDGVPGARVMNSVTREVVDEYTRPSWDAVLDALNYHRGPNRDRPIEIEAVMPESAKHYFASLEIEIFGERKKF